MGHYVLRPWWQRLPFAGGQLFLGCALAALILGSRARIIRRLYILPPSSANPAAQNVGAAASKSTSNTTSMAPLTGDHRVVIQCVPHFRGQGKVFPMRECTLDKGKDESELVLWVKNIRGHHWLGLQDASIDGKKLSVGQMREEIFKHWYGEKEGKKMRAEERWKSGPVVDKST